MIFPVRQMIQVSGALLGDSHKANAARHTHRKRRLAVAGTNVGVGWNLSRMIFFNEISNYYAYDQDCAANVLRLSARR